MAEETIATHISHIHSVLDDSNLVQIGSELAEIKNLIQDVLDSLGGNGSGNGNSNIDLLQEIVQNIATVQKTLGDSSTSADVITMLTQLTNLVESNQQTLEQDLISGVQNNTSSLANITSILGGVASAQTSQTSTLQTISSAQANLVTLINNLSGQVTTLSNVVGSFQPTIPTPPTPPTTPTPPVPIPQVRSAVVRPIMRRR